MGTSNENKRSKDEEEMELSIPWAFVSYSVRVELIKKLNPDATITGNNWRMLASDLGYTTGDINCIESEKENNTAVLFKQYDTKAGASLNEVCRSLEKMQRKDCLDIIRKALPEIQQAYNKANESQMLHAARTTPVMAPVGQFQWPGSSCSCSYTNHPNPAYGSHACCSYTHNFTNCGAACHSHHLGACPSPYVVQQPHPHHTMCQTLSHLDTAQKTFEPSFSPPHHSMPSIHGCLVQQQPGCHCSVNQSLGSGSPNCSLRQPGNQASAQCAHPGFSPGHTSYKGSPTYSPNQNVSSMPLPNNISAVDNSNLISSDSSSSSSDSFNGVRQKIARQYSNESNVSQVLNGDKRLRNNNSKEILESRDTSDQGCASLQRVNGHTANLRFRPINSPSPMFADTSDYVDDRDKYYFQDCNTKVRNGSSEFIHKSSSRSAVAYGEGKTSLALLEKLAAVPDKFKPTNEYKTVVVEQKIEVDKRSRDGKTSMDSSVSQSSKWSSTGRNHPSNIPNRINVNPDHSMEGLKSLTIPARLTPRTPSTESVDNNKAFRNIEVFVTYSYDSESHGKQVLSLCKFLQTNGFACSVDVCEKKSSAKSLEQLEWCRRKVLEADFILVCISQKYLEDISSTSSSFFSQTNERQLHAREIYELMNYEYLNNQHSYVGESNGCNNSAQRFIPLLFAKMTHSHVPPWMMNGPAYIWPQQYKDLAWMLTKPQERFIGRRKILEEQLQRERSDSDLDVAGGMDMTNLMNSVLCSS